MIYVVVAMVVACSFTFTKDGKEVEEKIANVKKEIRPILNCEAKKHQDPQLKPLRIFNDELSTRIIQ